MADEVIQKSMTLLPEYQERFLKDLLANVYQVDEETGMISGFAAASPLEGRGVFDEQGQPVYQTDAQGNPVLDQYGDPVQVVEGGVPRPDIIRFTDPQREALEMGRGQTGAYQPFLDTAQQTLGAGQTAYESGIAQLGGTTGAYDPTSYRQFYDPFVEDVIDVTQQDIQRQADIERQRIGGAAVEAGAFGGSRQAVAEQELQRAADDRAAQMGAQLRSAAFTGAQQQAQSAFENQMNRGQTAAQAFGQLGQGLGSLGTQQGALGEATQALGQQDVNALFNVGSLEQAQLQAEYDIGRQGALEEAYEPFGRFAYMRDILSGLPSGQSTLGTAATPQTNPVGNIFSIANTLSGGTGGGGLFGLGSLTNTSGS